MIYTDSDIIKVLKQISELVLPSVEVPFIAAESHAHAPKGVPYMTARMLTVIPVGVPDKKYVNSQTTLDLDTTIYARMFVTMSINSFRDDANHKALQSLETFKLALRRDDALEIMKAENLGFIKAGEARELTDLSHGGYETRFQSDIVLSYVQSITSETRSILGIDIVGIYDGAFHPHTDTIEVREA